MLFTCSIDSVYTPGAEKGVFASLVGEVTLNMYEGRREDEKPHLDDSLSF